MSGSERDWSDHSPNRSYRNRELLEKICRRCGNRYTERSSSRFSQYLCPECYGDLREKIRHYHNRKISSGDDSEENKEPPKKVEGEILDEIDGELKISINEDDTEGQFDELEKELSISDTEREIIEKAIRERVNRTAEAEFEEVSEPMKDAISNLIASTLRQEYKEMAEE